MAGFLNLCELGEAVKDITIMYTEFLRVSACYSALQLLLHLCANPIMPSIVTIPPSTEGAISFA